LDITAPLRTINDINSAFDKIANSDADLVCSGYIAERNPYFNMVELDENGYAHLCKKPKENVLSRQSAPLVYSLNSSIYIFRREFLLNTPYAYNGKVLVYEMPDYAIDIDRPIDFDFIEFILKEGRFKFDY